MKAMSKFWTALVVGVAVIAVSTHSWAVPLSNTNLSWSQFTSLADLSSPVGIPFSDTFIFQRGPQGEITSGVFTGIGDAAGLYVYIYQIKVYSTPSGKVDELSIPLLGPGPTTVSVSGVGNVSSFYIGSGVPLGFFYGQGDKAPTSSTFTSPPPVISFVWGDPNQVFQGQASYIVGFFSPVLPTTTEANLSDGGRETKFPLVYTPSPEPSISLLLGAGLLGGVIWSRGRKRMKKA
jgi:hypothetical protein